MAAALEVHHGDGHVLLLGFRPQWRGQPHETFKVLFNSLLFHGALADQASGTPEFWAAPDSEEEEEEGTDAENGAQRVPPSSRSPRPSARR